MKPLSPAAEAIWKAFNDIAERVGAFEDYGDALAAFTRALADQVVPEHAPWHRRGGEPAARHKIRLEILSIAAELEGHQ